MKPYIIETSGELYRVSESEFEGLFMLEIWVGGSGWELEYSHDFPLTPGLVTNERIENYKRGQVIYTQEN